MSITQSLLEQIITTARSAGMDQLTLASRAGVAAETISRAKKRGTIDLTTLAALAQACGLNLALTPASPVMPGAEQIPATPVIKRSSLADPARGLAWSNPAMSNDALVRNALYRGSLDLVVEAVLEHGLVFVRQQWAFMLADQELPVSARLREDIDRKLANIERGLEQAEADLRQS